MVIGGYLIFQLEIGRASASTRRHASYPGTSSTASRNMHGIVRYRQVGYRARDGMILKMLSRLVERFRRPPAPPAVPAGMRVYAIGDVHGMLRELDQLLARIVEDDAVRTDVARHLIFLGDLIDRGPDSAGVVERCRTLRLEGFTTSFLMGNHEEVLLNALDGEREALKLFSRIGGRETMLSYGVDPIQYDESGYDEMMVLLQDCVPDDHRAFLATGGTYMVHGDYAFVHAGIRPGVALGAQAPADLRWIRGPFLDHGSPHEKVIVHGHTVSEQPERRANRIGIDTGAYRTGILTAVGLEGHDQWIVQNV